MKKKMPRLLIAAPGSGCGKTTVTCGLLALLKKKGLHPAAVKCGPDYIDPMFHRRILGVPSGNLDLFFTGEDTVRFLLARKAEAADITLLEGVMGYYDGCGEDTERASTYEMARVTGTPVLLVLDGRNAGMSLAASAKGIASYRKDSGIAGIFLNRVSEARYGKLKELLERECGIPVVGYLPSRASLQIPSRHLGLVAPEELDRVEEWKEALTCTLEQTVELDRLLELAGQAGPCDGREPVLPVSGGPEEWGKEQARETRVRLAVAEDEAFSFYYEENRELLERMGAQLVPFSPLHDKGLPEDTDGLILGGGYPEIYAKELEASEEMRREIKKACKEGLPCLAECGGFLYLQQELEGADGGQAQMAGVLPGKGFRTERLQRFGYLEAELGTCGLLGEKGQKIRGHEFHHWDSTENGADCLARKASLILQGEGASWPCMVHTPTMAAGFPHFYYYSNPEMIASFLHACRSFRAGKKAKERWDKIAKPIDSLGLLEDAVVKICRIAESSAPPSLSKRALVVLCADHGVVAEGVTQTGKEVTRIVSENFAAGCSTVNHMARRAGVDVYTVDLGMDTPPFPEKRLVQGAVIDRKVARGSRNLAREAAMTLPECRQAVETGIRLAGELKKMGYEILATGEMGIGNTTPTSVLASLLLQLPAEQVTGKGAGLSREGQEHKCRVVKQAVERVKAKGITDPMEILAEAGGLEIAGMAGVFLGAVRFRIPVVMDGAISCVAALAAAGIDSRVPDFCLASHVSEEATGRLALEALGLEAMVHAKMCLGEGTGAMTLFPLLDMGLEVYREMGSFTDYEIDPYTRYSD